MTKANSTDRPKGAALDQRARNQMDVVMHIGAHRCATRSFQTYLSQNAEPLGQAGLGHWGPERLRSGLMAGVLRKPAPAIRRAPYRRCQGRVALALKAEENAGIAQLVASDADMLGDLALGLKRRSLYPEAGERVARFFQAFGGRVSDVVLNIRALDGFWSSALSAALAQGYDLPDVAMLEELAAQTRSWRDVITDVACATPNARLWVLPFETFGGRPDAQLLAVTARDVPRAHARDRLNAAPRLEELRALPGLGALPQEDCGRWQPFSALQQAALRETYADDLMWLTNGADGLAWLMDDPEPTKACSNAPPTDMTRGRPNDQESRMAKTR